MASGASPPNTARQSLPTPSRRKGNRPTSPSRDRSTRCWRRGSARGIIRSSQSQTRVIPPANSLASRRAERCWAASSWEDKSDAGYIAQGIVLTGYDASKRNFVEYGFANDGAANPGSVTITGNTWNGTYTRADRNGNVYKMKYLTTFSTDGRSASTVHE